MLLAVSSQGCAQISAYLPQFDSPSEAEVVVEEHASIEKVQIFRRAETERAKDLNREIGRLQTDLRRAEDALIEAESGLAGTHSRADAVSSLAVARIGVERAANRAPWRRLEIQKAREKLDEAERQLHDERYGAALFFAYRAQRYSESLIEEAEIVEGRDNTHVIRARHVNLRAGPSTDQAILSVLEAGTPVFIQARQEDWILLQVSGGPTGWIHRSLLGGRLTNSQAPPAARLP